MANKQSFTITVNNNKTEDEGIEFITQQFPDLFRPDKNSRKEIIKMLGLDGRFIRAFDLVRIKNSVLVSKQIAVENPEDIVLIELKCTKKKLIDFPEKFFFGATKNEFDLAEKLGDQFNFCLVCLNPETRIGGFFNIKELKKLIKTQRVQYQINL